MSRLQPLRGAIHLSVFALPLYLGMLWSRSLVFGSEAGGWIYPYVQGPALGPLMLGLALGGGVAVLLHTTRRWHREHEAVSVALWVGLGFLVSLLMRCVAPFSLGEQVASPGAMAFFHATEGLGPGEVLRRFDELTESAPLHVWSNMPGKLVLFSALRGVTDSAAALGVFLVVLSCGVGALTYLLARRWFGNPDVALAACILTLFVPSRLYFLPLLNPVSPLLFLGLLLLLQRGLAARPAWALASLGVLVYVTWFFDPMMLTAGLIGLGVLVLGWRQGQWTPRRLPLLLSLPALTFAGTYLLVRLLFDFDLFTTFADRLDHAASFNQMVDRPYGVWIWANLPDFWIHAGVIPALLFLAYLVHLVLETLRTGTTILLRPGPLLALLTLALVLLLDLLGINRGEVTRLWIFLTVPLAMVVAHTCATHLPRWVLPVVTGAMILQATVTLAMVGFVVP